MDMIAEIRGFNRFYTRRIGLLDEHLPATDFTLAEARVLYELATGGEQTAAELGRKLGMDKAHLSRIAGRFTSRGLTVARVSPHHRRHRLLSLTEKGRAAFAEADRASREQMAALLAPLAPPDRHKLVTAMREFRAALDGQAVPSLVIRAPRPGDLGRVIQRQMLAYQHEYGWDGSYEILVAKILGGFDPAHEDGWIAELGGAIAGSIFLMRGPDPETARLRLLYVEAEARGHGIGRRLVTACIARARDRGYRRLTLWTNDILVAARKIYQTEGFVLEAEEAHHSFGKDLVGQTWTLDLSD